MANRFLCSILLALCAAGASAQDKRVRYGDPFILLHDGVYYAYGTSLSDGFEVLVSDDLHAWRRPGGVRTMALKKGDAWGEDKFWAPEVHRRGDTFYMYYSAGTRICVATAASPLGPFTQDERKPLLDGEQCIDNSLFTDDDGRSYMFFDRFNDGLNVWVADMDENLTALKPETMTKCIAVSQPWERSQGRVNEGPYVIKHAGRYWMTYSGNDFRSKDYGIGVATADSLHGRWTKYDGNPVWQRPGGLVGVGHSAMFVDRQGTLRIVFHAHSDTAKVSPRAMYISTVRFENKGGREVMTVGPEYITAVMAE